MEDKYYIVSPGMLPDNYEICKDLSVKLDDDILTDKKLKLTVKNGEMILGKKKEKKTKSKPRSKTKSKSKSKKR